MIKPYKKILFILLINLFIGNIYSQRHSPLLLSLQSDMENEEHDVALVKLKKIKESSLSSIDKALYNHLLGRGNSYNDQFERAYNHYLIAKKLYIANDSIEKAMLINYDIYNLISAQENFVTPAKKYLNEYMAYAEKTQNKLMLANGYFAIGNDSFDENNPHKSLEYFRKALNIFKDLGKDGDASSLYTNIAAVYNEGLHKPDSALYYLNNQLIYIKHYGKIEDLCYNYVNQAGAYYYLKQHNKAIEYLKMADNLPLKHYKGTINQYLNEFLYKNYDALGDYANAYKYFKLSKAYQDSVSMAEQNIAINDIHTKYRTKEKELENNLLKSDIKLNKIMLYTSIGLLLAGFVIATLLIMNSRRREKIMRQEKLIEQQKLEKALKDYELHSIDMMLEGQEKERQRIANDLHDNLGSMLATLKLNFENLKLRKMELRDEENKLYERTDELIEEAYQKVRGLAHAKNAGVFASEGLIPAIQKLAEKISIPGKLQLQVIAFGFKERLENALEIAIFRTVQELSTNIIKHSQASEATIHLTDHGDNINIIIEDNGIGFEHAKADTADGMGLQNIKKKIVQLGGSFEIDSTPGKGTTIIIDIPVND